MTKVTFIGTGAWASGLASTLSKNNHQITMWGIDTKENEDINNGLNTKYFKNTKFNNPQNIKATLDLEIALKEPDYIVIAVPSQFLASTLTTMQKVLKNRKVNLINVAKGIDSTTKEFFSEVIKKQFKNNLKNYCSIIGPSFAIEVFEDQLTMINAVGPNKSYLKEVAKIFNNNTFRIVPIDNENGAQLFAALKNVLAIGMGMVNFYMPYQNPQAALLSIGIKEIHNVYKTLYPTFDDTMGFELSGIGDILLTCTSPKSRNFTFGYSVARDGLENTLAVNNKTIEGYHAAAVLKEILEKNKKIKAPFLKSIIDILFNDYDALTLLNFIEEY